MANRSQLLKEIQEISFVVNDLTLYLDTHPQDANALECFSQAGAKRKELMDSFASQYEPLTIDCVRPTTQFTWSDGPLPWDNQGGAF